MQDNALLVFWPTNLQGYALQSTLILDHPVWVGISELLRVSGEDYVLTAPFVSSSQFYRLKYKFDCS